MPSKLRRLGRKLWSQQFPPRAVQNFDLPGNMMNSLLTGAVGQINGTTYERHNINRVGIGTAVFALGAPRQIEFGLQLTF